MLACQFTERRVCRSTSLYSKWRPRPGFRHNYNVTLKAPRCRYTSIVVLGVPCSCTVLPNQPRRNRSPLWRHARSRCGKSIILKISTDLIHHLATPATTHTHDVAMPRSSHRKSLEAESTISLYRYANIIDLRPLMKRTASMIALVFRISRRP